MLEFLALAGVAGVFTITNSLLDLRPITAGASPQAVPAPGANPAACTVTETRGDDTAAPYRDMLETIFDDDDAPGGLSRDAGLAGVEALAACLSAGTAPTPVISDYSSDDQLIVAFTGAAGGDMSVEVRDREGDAHILVDGAPVAVVRGAAGTVSPEDILLMPEKRLT